MISQAEWEAGVREVTGWWTLSESQLETALRTANLTSSERKLLQVLAQQKDRISPVEVCRLMGWNDGGTGGPASIQTGKVGRKLFKALKRHVRKGEMPSHVILSYIRVERGPEGKLRWDWFPLPSLTKAVRKVLGTGPPKLIPAASSSCRCSSCRTHGPLLAALERFLLSTPRRVPSTPKRLLTTPATQQIDEERHELSATLGHTAVSGSKVWS
jgi:hypothetical protein